MHFRKQRPLAELHQLNSHAYSRWPRTLVLCVATTVLACALFWALHRLSLVEPQSSSSAFAVSSSQSVIPTVTLCELLANPQFYDVKVIRVEAILVANHGDRSLYDPSCITMEPMVGVQPDPSLQFEPEGGVDRAFYDLVEQKSADKTASERMMMVGRFEGPNFLKDGRQSRFQHKLVLMKLERAESVAQETSAPPQP